jgi:hypothetical protein
MVDPGGGAGEVHTGCGGERALTLGRDCEFTVRHRLTREIPDTPVPTSPDSSRGAHPITARRSAWQLESASDSPRKNPPEELTVFKRILVPLDGSSFGEAALRPALALARKSGGELRLLSVQEDGCNPMHAGLQNTVSEVAPGIPQPCESYLSEARHEHLGA